MMPDCPIAEKIFLYLFRYILPASSDTSIRNGACAEFTMESGCPQLPDMTGSPRSAPETVSFAPLILRHV